ncbi:T9SS type A sorting domain-containing protein [bacterium SCSIO 12741]|nr:T9SS type A sorting domain-containing protein [bacterium SCSIO 12741]
MKTPKIILCCLLIGLVWGSAFAQQSTDEKRENLIQKEEVKIERFIQKHLDDPFPKSEWENLEDHDHDGHNAVKPSPESMEEIKRLYWRQQYFVKNPGSAALYTSPGGAPALSCQNGDFEMGNFSFYTGARSRSTACDSTQNILGLNWTPINMTAPPVNDFLITNNVADPVIPQLRQTHNNSSHAARINWINPCRPNAMINRLTKEVVLTSSFQNVGFYYAMVQQDPSHIQQNCNQNPYFIARALDAAGNVLDQYERIARTTDPFFTTVTGLNPNNCWADDIVWSDWTCNFLNVSGRVGDTITVEFYASDCAATAHFGYAYVDDICEECLPDSCDYQGHILFDQTDTCLSLPGQICGSYHLAFQNCSTSSVHSIQLTILQNGVDVTVGTVPVTIDAVNSTFCFDLDSSHFPNGASGGFDFRADIVFNLNGAFHTETNVHSNPGQNNDLIWGVNCCPDFYVVDCCTYWYGDDQDALASSAVSSSDSLIQALVLEYKNRINSKRENRAFGVEESPDCDPCEFKNDTFPIFILDENGVLIDDSKYTISWSHRPGWSAAYSWILPNDSTTVILSDSAGNCVDTLHFAFLCCPPIKIDMFCGGCDPCADPEKAFFLNVLDSNNNPISPTHHSFKWSTGSTGSSINGYVNNTYWVEVTDSNGCTQTDTFRLECCIPDIPVNLRCSHAAGGGTLLTWDPVNGADYYIIEVIIGDPACCFWPMVGYGTMYISDTNQLLLSGYPCGSFRVYAVCEDGRTSPYSVRHCLCPLFIVYPCDPVGPINLYSQLYLTHVQLNWDPIPGAIDYEVVIYDDQVCCGFGTGSPTSYIVNANHLALPLGTCGSWEVRSRCPDSVYSAYSSLQCIISSGGGGGQGMAPEPKVDNKQEIDPNPISFRIENVKVHARPNPSDGWVEFQIHSTEDEIRGTIMILNLDGQIMQTLDATSNIPVRADLSELPQGTYLYLFETNGTKTSSKKLILKP